jgi:hypothetical protein
VTSEPNFYIRLIWTAVFTALNQDAWVETHYKSGACTHSHLSPGSITVNKSPRTCTMLNDCSRDHSQHSNSLSRSPVSEDNFWMPLKSNKGIHIAEQTIPDTLRVCVCAFRAEGKGRFKQEPSAAGRRTQSCLATLPRLAGPGKYSVHADVSTFQSCHPFAFQTRRWSIARSSKDMSKMDSKLHLF